MSWWCERIHLLGDMNVCTKFHVRTSNSCEIFHYGPRWWFKWTTNFTWVISIYPFFTHNIDHIIVQMIYYLMYSFSEIVTHTWNCLQRHHHCQLVREHDALFEIALIKFMMLSNGGTILILHQYQVYCSVCLCQCIAASGFCCA